MKDEGIRAKLQDRLWGFFLRLDLGLPPALRRVLFCWPCEPVEDMCRRPEHDYCVRCSRPMPGQAPRSPLQSTDNSETTE